MLYFLIDCGKIITKNVIHFQILSTNLHVHVLKNQTTTLLMNII